MTRQEQTTRADQRLARLRAMPHHGLAPITLGTHWDITEDSHLIVLETLEAEGWTVAWADWTIPAGAEIVCGDTACPVPTRGHRHPHPRAGETIRWGKATPPDYDRTRDPVAAGTAAAIQATGNSDGAGRGDYSAGPGVAVAATAGGRDLRTARTRQEQLDHPYGPEWDQ